MARIVAERWTPCPDGELDRLEAHLHTRHFWHMAGTIVLAVATLLAVAGASYLVADAVWPTFSSGRSGGGGCGQCEPAPCAPACEAPPPTKKD
jgi:hypothetical protein